MCQREVTGEARSKGLERHQVGLDGREDFTMRNKATTGSGGAVQSGAPANIQLRMVLIDRAGSCGCPKGIRLAISAVKRRVYSSEALGLPGTTALFR